MDETRRFLRFVLPGAIFGILSVVLLLLLIPEWTTQTLQDLTRDAGVGSAVAGLVGTGALGYLFSAVHHELTFRLDPKWSTLDHTVFVRAVMAADRVVVSRVKNGRPEVLKAEEIDRDVAHSVVSALWYQHLGDEPLKSAEGKTQGLNDTAHSAGIARVAALTACALSIIAALSLGRLGFELVSIVRFVAWLILGPGSVWVFWTAYMRIGRNAQRLIEHVLSKAMQKDDSAAGLNFTV
jgi:predicted outer membrane lipoprotein